MGRSVPIVGGLLLVLAALVLAAPFAMGFGIEHAYGELIRNAASQSQGRFSVESEFDRGWFRSTARTTIHLGPDSLPEANVVELAHSFSHGPIPLGEIAEGRSPVRLVYVVADTRYHVDPAELPNIAASLGDRPLVLVRFWLALDGQTDVWLEVPPIEVEGGGFVSAGLQGNLAIEPGDATAEGHFRQGRIAFEDPTGKLELDSVRLDFGLTPLDPVTKRLDRTRLQGSVEFGGLLARGRTNQIDIEPSRIDFDNELAGTTVGAGTLSFTLGAARAWMNPTGEGEPAYVLTPLAFEQQTVQTEGDPLQSYTARSHFERLDTPSGAFGPGRLEVAVRNIDTRAWAALQAANDAIEQSALDENARNQARLALINEHLPKVLGPSPELAIERLEIAAQAGTLSASGRLGVDASDPMMLGHPMMLMASIQADAQLRAPTALLDGMVDLYLADTVREDAGPLSEADIMEMASFMRMAMIGQLVSQGQLVIDGSDYRFDAKYEDGLPYINGKPVDPSFLQGVVPGF